MTKKITEKLREDILKKKEQFFIKYRNEFLKNYNCNNEGFIKNGVIIPEPLPAQIQYSSKILKNIKENRDFNNKMITNEISFEPRFKDSKGNIVENPSRSSIEEKYSDNYMVDFNVNLKNQKHITKINSKGKNLDQVHDNNFDALSSSKKVFSEPLSLEEFQKVADDSLKISEARGVVINEQSKIFKDCFIVNKEKYQTMNVSAVTLSSNITVDNDISTEAKVTLHSSLFKTSDNSFMNSIEINYAKLIAKQRNTEVLVTGDVSVNDVEVKEFIGDHRLIILESSQTNFDYYIRATTIFGEKVVIRGDLKNRPIERLDNVGEMNSLDDFTYMAVGEVTNSEMKEDKINSYCDKNLESLNEKLKILQEELVKTNDSKEEFRINYQIDLIDIQIAEFKAAKESKSLDDIKSFSGVKPLFYDFVDKKTEKEKADTDNLTLDQNIFTQD